MRRRVRLITFAIAILLGIVLGWLTLPAWRTHRALKSINSPDPAGRREAWERLLIAEGEIECARAEAHLVRINRRLAGAHDEALLEAGVNLRACDLWNWRRQEADLLLRDLRLRAAHEDETEQRFAAELMRSCPRDVDARVVMGIFGSLLRSEARKVRRAAFEGACGWVGRDEAPRLSTLDIPAGDVKLRRSRELALSWARPARPPEEIDAEAPVNVVEAALLRATIGRPDDAAPVLDVLESWSGAPRPAFESILRHSDDERAAEALQRLADGGSAAARFALAARNDEADAEFMRRLAEDAAQTPATRRLAAWRCASVPRATVRAILSLDPQDADGEVYAAALLAERRLPLDKAIDLAESWIRSFNDDEKRAGALLAALLGKHLPLLEQACELENVPAVRTTQRLALWAVGRSIGEGDPIEFAHRTLHRADGDFSADTAFCMLLAGRGEAVALLTGPPPDDDPTAVRARAWLIDRFVPHWQEAIGWPIGGDRRRLRLHFDRLDALHLLTQRDLRFDPHRKIYAETSSGETSTPASVRSGLGG
ncbi:MAG: hypothetical protein SYC29_18145 [Planctomycetota bacterium]|nr:hypothetical protein [Planctomycetota bacterium]